MFSPQHSSRTPLVQGEWGMTAATVIYPVAKEDLRYAGSAAQWMSATYAGVAAQLRGSGVELTGAANDQDLIRIWRTCLSNERLVDAARSGRATLMEGLLK